ncbi:MAG TPA: 4Fe-4S binding protein, partial [Mizugakiibacter sp.]
MSAATISAVIAALRRDARGRCGNGLRLLAGLALLLAASMATAAGIDAARPQVRGYFPDATRFGAVEGTPPAAAVYRGDAVIGYAFETRMVAPVPAYSGEPINILVAIDRDGRIVGAEVLEQHEPILLVGIPVQKLYDFVARYIGRRATDEVVVGGGGGKNSVAVDAISSATVTAMAVNQTVMDAALRVAVSRRLVAAPDRSAGERAHVRRDLFHSANWSELSGNGAIRHLQLTGADVEAAFRKLKGGTQAGFVGEGQDSDAGNSAFIDLYYADITPPTVGRNLLGDAAYADLMARLAPGDEAIAVMANGRYSFKGVGYVRGGIFDRVHVVQDNKLILFHDSDYQPLVDAALADMPAFAEMAVFIVRHGYGFDPGRPWTLQLLVRRQVGPLQSVYTTFDAGYRMPAAYLEQPPVRRFGPFVEPGANAPMWAKVWFRRRFEILGLALGLGVLGAILIFQDWFVRRPTLLERLRVGFLVYTVVFIGWYGLAQLSVVNVFAFIGSALHQFQWSTFLADPLIFILWVFVAVSALLVGRGVYCGWLCPFGALQALVNKAARRFRVPQLELPAFVHERLWAIKYIVLLVLFGLSLQSVVLAERYAEVEPFKTAIDLHFMRSWGYVAYAVALLAVSAFNSKFYCKYVCPLGAGLAIGGRLRLFEWLRRRRECGHPCQVCANECEVQAIDPIGRINHNECHYCLDCQVTYWNDHKCPPLVERRKRMERAMQAKVVVYTDAAPAAHER